MSLNFLKYFWFKLPVLNSLENKTGFYCSQIGFQLRLKLRRSNGCEDKGTIKERACRAPTVPRWLRGISRQMKTKMERIDLARSLHFF